ncbi:unnamed protein product [Linum trigynum]|uniref:Uncharacterized protein n=1 Tax=Linum trigynum TaxID=586398 RepID=A0AAV2ERS5_9ROSI
MSAVAMPLAGGGTSCSMQTESIAGQRCPPSSSSSPNPKGDREAQQSKKRVKPTLPVDEVDSDTEVMPEDVPMGEKPSS